MINIFVSYLFVTVSLRAHKCDISIIGLPNTTNYYFFNFITCNSNNIELIFNYNILFCFKLTALISGVTALATALVVFFWICFRKRCVDCLRLESSPQQKMKEGVITWATPYFEPVSPVGEVGANFPL